MSKLTFIDYLKEKNITMTEEDKFYCLSMINTDVRFLSARQSNKSWCNGLVFDYLMWDKDQRIADLEAKLAEKDKEIENIGKYYDKVNYDLRELCHKKEQDKTTFAIEKLEQVKEFCNQREKDFTYLRDEIKAISHNKWVDYIEELRFIKSHINNQIKQLKEDK